MRWRAAHWQDFGSFAQVEDGDVIICPIIGNSGYYLHSVEMQSEAASSFKRLRLYEWSGDKVISIAPTSNVQYNGRDLTKWSVRSMELYFSSSDYAVLRVNASAGAKIFGYLADFGTDP